MYRKNIVFGNIYLRYLKKIYFVFKTETRNSRLVYKVKCRAYFYDFYEDNIK